MLENLKLAYGNIYSYLAWLHYKTISTTMSNKRLDNIFNVSYHVDSSKLVRSKNAKKESKDLNGSLSRDSRTYVLPKRGA